MSCEILKREEKCASFAVVPQTAKVMAETPQKLVRMEKSLKYDPIDDNVFYSKKKKNLYIYFRNGSPEMSGTEALNA